MLGCVGYSLGVLVVNVCGKVPSREVLEKVVCVCVHVCFIHATLRAHRLKFFQQDKALARVLSICKYNNFRGHESKGIHACGMHQDCNPLVEILVESNRFKIRNSRRLCVYLISQLISQLFSKNKHLKLTRTAFDGYHEERLQAPYYDSTGEKNCN